MSPMLNRIDAIDREESLKIALAMAERVIRVAALGGCQPNVLKGAADDIKELLEVMEK